MRHLTRTVAVIATTAALTGALATTATAASNPRSKCTTVNIPAAFPNCTNTGVPAWANLSSYVINNDITVKPGDPNKFTNRIINGRVIADGTDVTISKSIIRDGGSYKLETKNGGSITVTDSEIDGNGGNGGIAVGNSNITLDGVWLHDIVDGVRLGWNVKVVDSLITDNHDDAAGHHPDSTQTSGGQNSLIQHSTLLAFRTDKDTQANAGVEIGAETSEVKNLTIRDSFIDGGNYGILMQTPGKGDQRYPMSNVKIVNNTFGGNHRFGPLAVPATGTVPGMVVSGNKMADGSAAKVKVW